MRLLMLSYTLAPSKGKHSSWGRVLKYQSLSQYMEEALTYLGITLNYVVGIHIINGRL